jgi:hypothetical protein
MILEVVLQAGNRIISSMPEVYNTQDTFSTSTKESCTFSTLTIEFSTHFAENQWLLRSFFSTLTLEPTQSTTIEADVKQEEKSIDGSSECRSALRNPTAPGEHHY